MRRRARGRKGKKSFIVVVRSVVVLAAVAPVQPPRCNGKGRGIHSVLRRRATSFAHDVLRHFTVNAHNTSAVTLERIVS